MQINMELPKKIRPLLEKKKRFKVAIGGRGSAKSTSFADIFLLKACTEAAKVGCFREFQNSIEESVYALFKTEIKRIGAPGFDISKTSIDHESGGGFRFKGLARSIDAIKSMYGFKYFWVEEAQFLSKESIEILVPTVRETDSELWFSGNPRNSNDPFSQRFIVPFLKELKRDGHYEDADHIIVFINHDDNPWFPAVLETDRRRDFHNLDRALYDHIWEGAFSDYVEDSIIKAEWFDACVDAHLALGWKPRGAIIVAHDPSDLGADDKAFAVRHGGLVLDVQTRKIGDANEGCDWALDAAINHRADAFVWDCDGLGASLARQVRQSLAGKKIEPIIFKGSNSVDFPDQLYENPALQQKDHLISNANTFKNKRAQYYWALRDRVLSTYQAVVKNEYKDPDTIISFSSKIKDLQQLRSEVCSIPRKYNSNGLIQIMDKDQMKRLLKLSSPNMADALMMSMVPYSSAPIMSQADAMPEYEEAY